MSASAVSVQDARRRIFESVFPPNASASIPTPLASPAVSFLHQLPPPPPPPQPLAPPVAVPTHGYNTRHHPHHSSSPSPSSALDVGAGGTGAPAASVSLLPSPATVLARESRAWHLATSFLSFPNSAFPATAREWIQDRYGGGGGGGSGRGPGPGAGPGANSRDAIEAIRYLVLSNEDGNIVDGRENLMEWYVCEVRRHFLGWVKPFCDIPLVRFALWFWLCFFGHAPFGKG